MATLAKRTQRTKAAHHLARDMNAIKKAVKQGVQDAKAKTTQYLSEYYDDALEKSANVQNELGHYLSRKPIQTVGIAMLAGLAIGYFLNRS